MQPTQDAGDAAAPLRRAADAEIDVYGVTHAGRVRAVNEDHFLIAAVGRTLHVLQTSVADLPALALPALPPGKRSAFIAVVADGVGGVRRGADAARFAVESVTAAVARRLHHYLPDDSGDSDRGFSDELAATVRRTHDELRRRGRSDAGAHDLATTLTLWVGIGPRAYVLQVGDSRAYVFRRGELTQVSQDQTVAEELVQRGVLSRVQAAATRWAHVLSSAIGGPATAPVVTPLRNDWESVHLLCSDGLTKHVSDEHIRMRLATMTSARQACEALLQDALDAGGTDNITILIGRPVAGA